MKRDTRKNIEYFDKWIAYDRERIEIMKTNIEQFPVTVNSRHVGYLHNFANKHLRLLVSRYSRGDESNDLADDCESLIDALEKFENAKDGMAEGDLAYPQDIDRSQRSIWLACLALSIFGIGATFERALRVALRSPDSILNEAWIRIYGTNLVREEDCVLQPAHKELLQFLRSDLMDVDQMNQYLEMWYARCSNCYWHETHHLEDGGYFGYWSFEAAFVAKLLKSDESTFGAHIYYPEIP